MSDPTQEQAQVPTTADYWPGSDATMDEPSPYKRSGKTKKDLLKCYAQRVKMSAKWRKDEYDDTWRRLVDLYRGKHFAKASTEDRIAVNVSFSTVNVIAPSVAVNNPHITVNPRSPDLADASDKVEAGVNYWWRRYDWLEEVQRTVKDSLSIGHGWVKLGWHYREKARPLSADERQQQYDQLRGQAEQAAFVNPAIAADLPSDYDIMQSVPDSTADVTHDCPFVERVSPFDLLIDPEATCVTDLKWIAQRIVAPIERVKADSRYKAAARNDLKADMATNPRWRDDTPNNSKASENRSDDIKRVTLWEFWDLQHEYYCVFADQATDNFLVEPTNFPYPFGIPYVHLPNYEVPDQFYSIGDLEMLEPMQQELNAVRSDMMNHRKRWQRAYTALRDKISPEAQNVLMSDRDGRIVWIDGDEDLGRVIQPIPQVSLDPQMYQYSDQIEADLQLVSGITEYQRGAAPEIRRTATEANLIQSATNARVSDKLAQIEHFMAEIAERVVQLAQQYLTGEEVARIVGPDGEQQWVTFTREEIAGQYDFTVEAGSTQPRDEIYRRNQALQLVQTLGPFIGQVIDPKAVVSYLLRDGFGIKNPDEFLLKQAPQQGGPQEKLIESLAYKDAPPDIQRQMEAQAGFQPSQMGGASPPELQAQQQDAAHASALEQADQQHQAALAQADQSAGHAQDQQMLDALLAQAQQQGQPQEQPQ